MSLIELNGDALDRGNYALSLYKIISDYNQSVSDGNSRKTLTNTDNNAFVLAISAPWGFGKTYFIDRLEGVLKRDESVINKGIQEFDDSLKYKPDNIIRYDAWKNDFWQNAFEPLFDCITSSTLLKNYIKNDDLKKASKALSYCGSVISCFFKLAAVTNDTAKVFSDLIAELKKANGDISQISDKLAESAGYTDYTLFRDSLNQLRTTLEAIVNKVGNIAIIIDELDRCRPTFAVQTLEIVKHLFNIKGITFIFSLDIIQLQHCVKVIYGNEFDAVGYLERFFDYTTLMPQGNRKQLFALILQEFGLQPEPQEQFDVYFKIIESFHLSIREIRAVCSTFYYLKKYELQGYPEHALQLYFYLTALKYKEPVRVMESISNLSTAKGIRTSLMNEYPPEFAPCSDNSQNTFKELFIENPVIKNYKDYRYVNSDGHYIQAYLYEICEYNSELCFIKKINASGRETLESGSASYALYHNDLSVPNLLSMTILEFLFGKVEMYNTAL